MKKISFLGVVLFAFQSIIWAQSDYGLNLGTDVMYINTNYQNITKPCSPSFKAGTYFERHLNDKFSYEIDLNFGYMLSSDNYELKNTLGVWQPDIFCETLNNNYFENDYLELSIPLLFKWNIGIISPFVGPEFYYKNSLNVKSNDNSYYNVSAKGLSVCAGFDINLSKRFNLKLNYSYGLTKDFKIAYYSYSPEELNTYFLKSNKFGISLQYKIKE